MIAVILITIIVFATVLGLQSFNKREYFSERNFTFRVQNINDSIVDHLQKHNPTEFRHQVETNNIKVFLPGHNDIQHEIGNVPIKYADKIKWDLNRDLPYKGTIVEVKSKEVIVNYFRAAFDRSGE